MDEIRQKFLCATSELDELEESLARVFARLDKTIDDLDRSGKDVTLLRRELSDVKGGARGLTEALRVIGGRFEAQAREPKDGVRKVV